MAHLLNRRSIFSGYHIGPYAAHALSDFTTLTAQSEAVTRALNSARETAALANERYRKGLSNYLDVVDAERAALQAEREETQLHGQRAISTILLAKALGGGWQQP